MSYTSRFTAFMPFIFRWEGEEYEDVPGDPGGPTKFGIDSKSHPEVNIKALTRDQATDIYWRDYWVRNGCEHFPRELGEVFFNACVNCGPGRAAKIQHDPAYPHTASGFLDGQEDFYRRLVIAKPALRKFLRGWLARTDALRKFVGA